MEPTRIACPCPEKDGGTRHPDGDTVTFRETMPFWRVESMRSDLARLPGLSESDVLGMLSEMYLVHGIESWSLETDDDKGKPEPIPVNRLTVSSLILPRYAIAATLSEVADGLYMEAVVLPLVERVLTSSQRSQTDASTSAPSTDLTPSSESDGPSKRSSTSTTPTAGTATISPLRDGASNSSRSKASAA